MNGIINFYENYDEDERMTTNKARKIEFITTTKVLDKLIDKNVTILDVGAGTGVYSFYYAKRGMKVHAIDITPKHIQVIEEKKNETSETLNLTSEVGDATDLNNIEDNTFDVVLCLGPMYHLTEEYERKKCIGECLRVLKNDGLLTIAYINKYFIMPNLVVRDNDYINSSLVDKVINKGIIREGDEDCFWTDAYFTTPEEIENTMRNYSVETVDHIATDGLAPILENIDDLSEEKYKVWLDYHLQTCREKSILGMSNHGLYICRKI